MSTDVAQTIFEKVSALPQSKQAEVLEFVERLAAPEEASAPSRERPIWEVIAEISSTVPDEEWAKLPSDGSLNVDHYLYGAPKKSS
jgi:hypothetical protein